MRLYQVVGRKAPVANDKNPPAYRMKLFAPNDVMAKSRFWYFMHQMRKMKKTTGEILDCNEVFSILSSYFNFVFLFFCICLHYDVDYRKEFSLCQELWNLD